MSKRSFVAAFFAVLSITLFVPAGAQASEKGVWGAPHLGELSGPSALKKIAPGAVYCRYAKPKTQQYRPSPVQPKISVKAGSARMAYRTR